MLMGQQQSNKTGEHREKKEEEEEDIVPRCLSFRNFLADPKFNTLDCLSESDHIPADDDGDDGDEDDGNVDFEFTPARRIAFPLYPVFGNSTDEARKKITSVPALENLLKIKEDDHCQKSETDDLDGISPETYCVWNPKKNDNKPPPVMGKSKSTGTSMPLRWRRLRDLFVTGRSKGDGKKRFIFLSPPPPTPPKTSRKEARAPLTYLPYRSEPSALFPVHRKNQFFAWS